MLYREPDLDIDYRFQGGHYSLFAVCEPLEHYNSTLPYSGVKGTKSDEKAEPEG